MNVAKVFGKTEVDSPIAAGAGKKIIRGGFLSEGGGGEGGKEVLFEMNILYRV